MCAKKSVGFLDVETKAFDLTGEVFFAAGGCREAGGEGKIAIAREGFVEVFHDPGCEDVHAKEAEVISGAETGNDELLFRDRGSGFFEDVGDFVESVMTSNRRTTNRSVKGEFAFMGGLDGGNGAVGLFGNGEKLTEAGSLGKGEIEVIIHHEKEGVVPGEFFGAKDRMAIPKRLALLDESDLFEVICHSRGEVTFGAGSDDDRGSVDPVCEDFIEQKACDGFGLARGAHECLKGEVLLVEAGCGDDRFLNLHGVLRGIRKRPLNDKAEGEAMGEGDSYE